MTAKIPHTVRLTEADTAAMDAAAARAGISRSAWIARTIQAALHPESENRSEVQRIAAQPDVAAELVELRQRIEALEQQATGKQPPRMYNGILRGEPVEVSSIPPAPTANGRYDKAATLALISQRLQEQDASGLRRDFKAIADELNANGLTQSNGAPWVNDRIGNIIRRDLPHLHQPRQFKNG